MRVRIAYYIKEAFSSFHHNWVMSFAAILVVLFSVLLVGTFLVMGHVVDKVATDVEKKVEIEVFLEDTAPKEDVFSMKRKIEALKEAKSVEYISKKEALDIFIKRNKDNKDLIEQIAGNPLPASYRVFLKNPRLVEKTVAKIKRFPEYEKSVNDVDYGKKIVGRLFAVTKWLRYIVLVLITFLCFSALALISNTIRLAIYARRREIAIMRLVGASNWFIRWPFLLEGIVQGLAGALLAIGVLAVTKQVVFGKLENQMSWFMSTLRISPDFYQNMLIMLLVAGVAIGAAGSLIALRRYLKT